MKKPNLDVVDYKLIESIILHKEEILSYQIDQDALEKCITKHMFVENLNGDMINVIEELVEIVINLTNQAAEEPNERVRTKIEKKSGDELY